MVRSERSLAGEARVSRAGRGTHSLRMRRGSRCAPVRAEQWRSQSSGGRRAVEVTWEVRHAVELLSRGTRTRRLAHSGHRAHRAAEVRECQRGCSTTLQTRGRTDGAQGLPSSAGGQFVCTYSVSVAKSHSRNLGESANETSLSHSSRYLTV